MLSNLKAIETEKQEVEMDEQALIASLSIAIAQEQLDIAYKWRMMEKRRKKRYAIMLALQTVIEHRVSPRIWAKPREKGWFRAEVLAQWPDERWLALFRLTRASFLALVEALRPVMAPHERSVRRPVPLEERVAMAVLALVGSCSRRAVADRFGTTEAVVLRHTQLLRRHLTADLLLGFLAVPRGGEEERAIAARYRTGPGSGPRSGPRSGHGSGHGLSAAGRLVLSGRSPDPRDGLVKAATAAKL